MGQRESGELASRRLWASEPSPTSPVSASDAALERGIQNRAATVTHGGATWGWGSWGAWEDGRGEVFRRLLGGAGPRPYAGIQRERSVLGCRKP